MRECRSADTARACLQLREVALLGRLLIGHWHAQVLHVVPIFRELRVNLLAMSQDVRTGTAGIYFGMST